MLSHPEKRATYSGVKHEIRPLLHYRTYYNIGNPYSFIDIRELAQPCVNDISCTRA